MDWQEYVALLIVAVTAAVFAWFSLRRRSGFACRTGCGCTGGYSSSAPSVVWRARKGERPQVVVKYNEQPPLRKTTN